MTREERNKEYTLFVGMAGSILALIVVCLIGWQMLKEPAPKKYHAKSSNKTMENAMNNLALVGMAIHIDSFEKGVRAVIDKKRVVRKTTYTKNGYFAKTTLE